MFKNVASQKIAVFAWDNAAGAAKTGDAANITAQISKDGAATAATNDVSPTELDATDAKGIYLFDMTQAETNADLVAVSPVSSTSDIVLRPVIIYTKISTADIWTATEDITGDTNTYKAMVTKLFRFFMNKMNITDANGAVALRNEADGADIATQTISDDSTTTVRTKLTWP